MLKLKNSTAARAVQPNAGVRAWYRSVLDDLLREAHLSLALELSPIWATLIPSSALAHDAPSPTVAIQKALDKWAKKWIVRFDRTALRIANDFTKRNFRATESAMREALRQAKFTVAFRPTKRSMEAFRAVVAEQVGLIKSIPQKYLTDVQTSVWNSVRKGSDMATLSRDLQKNYGVSSRRAALIALDQNAKAKATIEQARRLDLGLYDAYWQHSSAGKEPRPTHVKANGMKFDIRKGIWDADEGRYVLPGELINCRCTSRAIIPGLS